MTEDSNVVEATFSARLFRAPSSQLLLFVKATLLEALVLT
eukprot:CAMPEP_0196218422 /NCGR_PEP_ID=MMETSP0912-20130531/36515_1 /TAXON_ID=49265 /ORGANISM="Thalassiosira rotula, Strain GSO102" /LENGTH=39 /DNA_ID= /DNA_START= /DNA_END= /DNA_ORIENTATION=